VELRNFRKPSKDKQRAEKKIYTLSATHLKIIPRFAGKCEAHLIGLIYRCTRPSHEKSRCGCGLASNVAAFIGLRPGVVTVESNSARSILRNMGLVIVHLCVL
jgi:hypothetical protein